MGGRTVSVSVSDNYSYERSPTHTYVCVLCKDEKITQCVWISEGNDIGL